MRARDQPRFELVEPEPVSICGTIVGIAGGAVFIQPEGETWAIRAPLERAPKPAIGVVRHLEVSATHPPEFVRWKRQPEVDDAFVSMPPPGPGGLPPPGQRLPLAPNETGALKKMLRDVIDPLYGKDRQALCDDLLYLVRRAHGQGMGDGRNKV